jgi:hypothetical protein
MGILKILHFDWWQVMLVLVTLMAAPLVKALAAVIVGKFSANGGELSVMERAAPP